MLRHVFAHSGDPCVYPTTVWFGVERPGFRAYQFDARHVILSLRRAAESVPREIVASLASTRLAGWESIIPGEDISTLNRAGSAGDRFI